MKLANDLIIKLETIMKAKSMLNVPTAYIGVNKNRLKIYDDQIIFLENEQEFQFEIQNTTKNVVGVNIWINGELTSNQMLVLRQGEKTWLDRYLDSPNKYKFDTYEVPDNEESNSAIVDNGKVKIEFYREKQRKRKQLLRGNDTFNYYGGDIKYYSNPTSTDWSIGDITTTGTFTTDNINCSVNSYCSSEPVKETGRIEEGSISDQQFQNVFYDFECCSFHTVEYQLLPTSQKNVVTTNDVRKYCTSCACRIKKQSWTFCPTCGDKL